MLTTDIHSRVDIKWYSIMQGRAGWLVAITLAFSLLPNRISGVPPNVFVSLFLLKPPATVLLPLRCLLRDIIWTWTACMWVDSWWPPLAGCGVSERDRAGQNTWLRCLYISQTQLPSVTSLHHASNPGYPSTYNLDTHHTRHSRQSWSRLGI